MLYEGVRTENKKNAASHPNDRFRGERSIPGSHPGRCGTSGGEIVGHASHHDANSGESGPHSVAVGSRRIAHHRSYISLHTLIGHSVLDSVSAVRRYVLDDATDDARRGSSERQRSRNSEADKERRRVSRNEYSVAHSGSSRGLRNLIH